MNNLNGKNIKIFDSETNELICSGKVISSKDCFLHGNTLCRNIYFVSVNNKCFFNTYSKKFKICVCPEQLDIYIGDISKYSQKHLRNATKKEYRTLDIIFDDDINGLDKEVINLVTALNKIDGIKTDGSCCGHNEWKLWVSCQFFTVEALSMLLKIIYDKFPNDFMICSSKSRSQNTPGAVGLTIISCKKGQPAYDKANELAEYLNLL